MDDNLPPPLCCPKCGCQKFKFPRDPQPDADLVGCICGNCGTALTTEDIQQYFRNLGFESRAHLPRQVGLKRVG
jgi:hypothetical protein